MKILIVCSGNSPYGEFNYRIHQSFIFEQEEDISKFSDINFDRFLIVGKGLKGYLKNVIKLFKYLLRNDYDIIHAHGGLCGLLAILQPLRKKVIVTFHGSDINDSCLRAVSMFVALFAYKLIYVSEKMLNKSRIKKSSYVIPCGVNLESFYPIGRVEAIEKLNMDPNKKYVLFTSFFENKIKNAQLALEAVKALDSNDVELVELKSRSRTEVNLLLNACHLLLMTSFSEGSPQIIKEAVACNCPIISTDVGDVSEIIKGVEHCYIVPFSRDRINEKLLILTNSFHRTNGRTKIHQYDSRTIATKVRELYFSEKIIT